MTAMTSTPASVSFAAALPYRNIVNVEAPDVLVCPDHKLALMVLKDGTLAVGMHVDGLDVDACSDAAFNAQHAFLQEAFQDFPATMFLQAIFESGGDFTPPIDGFAAQGRADSLEVLRRGRQIRRDMLRQSTHLTRCTITYWLGLKQAVAKMGSKDTRPWTQAALCDLAQPLIARAALFTATAARINLPLRMMSEAAMLAACHRAVNPCLPGGLQSPLSVSTAAQTAAAKDHPHRVPQPATIAAQLPHSTLRIGPTAMIGGQDALALRALSVTKLADTTHPKALHDVMYTHLPQWPLRLVVTHAATDPAATRREMTWRRNTASKFGRLRWLNHGAELAAAQCDDVIREIDTRGGQLFETSLTAIICAPISGDPQVEAKTGIEVATRDIITGFARQGMVASVCTDQQLNAWLAALPADGARAAPATHKLLAPSCAHLLPYWLPSQGDRVPDVLFENRQRGLAALSVCAGEVREVANAMIVGSTGSGKTFLFSYLLKYGCLDLGGHVIIADTKGPENSSYRPLCDVLGGKYICLAQDKQVSFNPFPPHSEAIAADGTLFEHILEPVEQLVCMLAAPTSEDQSFAESVIRDLVSAAYRATTAAGPHIRLSDIIDQGRNYRGRNDNLNRVAKKIVEQLEVRLDDPRLRQLLNQRKAFALDHRFMVFDFYKMEANPLLAQVLVAVLANRIEAKLTRLPRALPKLFGFDEAWSLLKHSKPACDLLERLYRVARSHGAAGYVLTHSYADIVNSFAKDGIVANAPLLFLLKHLKEEEAIDALGLTPRQSALFRDLQSEADVFSEFLLINKQAATTHLLRYAPTPFDVWADNSGTKNITMREKMQKEHPDMPLVDIIAHLATTHPQGVSKSAAVNMQESA